MELTWPQQLAIFECRYPHYSQGEGSPYRNAYAAGFQMPGGHRAAESTMALVWIELYDPPPQGRPD